jgi:DNA-binding transcriptional LysR family regulator
MQAETQAVLRIAQGAARGDVRGEVTVSAPPALAAVMIAPLLASVGQQHPHLSIRLSGETRQVSLDRREAEIAIRLSRPTEPDLTIIKLMEIAFRPYATSDYLSSVEEDAWCFIGSDGNVRHSPQQIALQSMTGDGRYSFWSDDVSIQAALAQGGAGVAMLPDFVVPPHPHLVSAKPKDPPLIREVWLAVHSDMKQVPAIRVVMECLKKLGKPSLGHSPERTGKA